MISTQSSQLTEEQIIRGKLFFTSVCSYALVLAVAFLWNLRWQLQKFMWKKIWINSSLFCSISWKVCYHVASMWPVRFYLFAALQVWHHSNKDPTNFSNKDFAYIFTTIYQIQCTGKKNRWWQDFDFKYNWNTLMEENVKTRVNNV